MVLPSLSQLGCGPLVQFASLRDTGFTGSRKKSGGFSVRPPTPFSVVKLFRGKVALRAVRTMGIQETLGNSGEMHSQRVIASLFQRHSDVIVGNVHILTFFGILRWDEEKRKPRLPKLQ